MTCALERKNWAFRSKSTSRSASKPCAAPPSRSGWHDGLPLKITSSRECETPQCVRIANSMERAGEFLGAALRGMKDPEAARTWLKATWPKLVGDAMAAHIRPAAYAKGVLRIEADSREWQKQTESMNQEICERVNRSWGSRLVNEIC